MEISKLYDVFRASAGVNTDSRSITPGQLFFALKGETFDGNQYALKALEAGACNAVVNEDCPFEDERLVRVPDTLKALKELAAWHRAQVNPELIVIGLTGTNGKTTTKELIREVLSKAYRVSATEGNLNNDIGVPLTVLKITPETEIAVVEMGANHPDDISSLTWVSQPDYGLITNVGKAHLLGFGSFEGVKKAKGQLYDWLSAHDGQAFVNTDDAELFEMASSRSLSIIPYGIEGEGVNILPASNAQPFLRMEIGGELLETQLVGAYNAANVMAAVTVGRQFGVSLKDAFYAISAYRPSMNRSQLLQTGSNSVILDAYNANPSSMALALENIAKMEGEKAVLLGEMRELGKDSVGEHVKVLSMLEKLGLCRAFFVGEEFRKAVSIKGSAFSETFCFATSEELAAYLQKHPLKGCTVLVKGSRGTRMERLIASL